MIAAAYAATVADRLGVSGRGNAPVAGCAAVGACGGAYGGVSAVTSPADRRDGSASQSVALDAIRHRRSCLPKQGPVDQSRHRRQKSPTPQSSPKTRFDFRPHIRPVSPTSRPARLLSANDHCPALRRHNHPWPLLVTLPAATLSTTSLRTCPDIAARLRQGGVSHNFCMLYRPQAGRAMNHVEIPCVCCRR